MLEMVVMRTCGCSLAANARELDPSKLHPQLRQGRPGPRRGRRTQRVCSHCLACTRGATFRVWKIQSAEWLRQLHVAIQVIVLKSHVTDHLHLHRCYLDLRPRSSYMFGFKKPYAIAKPAESPKMPADCQKVFTLGWICLYWTSGS